MTAHPGTHLALVERGLCSRLVQTQPENDNHADSRQRSAGGALSAVSVEDDREIQTVDEFSGSGANQFAYVKAMESLTTTKGRVASVAKIVKEISKTLTGTAGDGEEDLDIPWNEAEWLEKDNDDSSDGASDYVIFGEIYGPTYNIQKMILCQQNIDKAYYQEANFLQGVDKVLLGRPVQRLIPGQQNLAMPFLHRVPMGVLLIMGPAGTG